VKLFIQHTNDQLLKLSLTSPEGTSIELFTNVGSTGHDFGSSCSPEPDCVLDDQAHSGIADARAPFIGRFSTPGLVLGRFNNENARGAWTLTIESNSRFGSGWLNCWCLEVNSTVCFVDPAVVTDSLGATHGVAVTVLSYLGQPLIGTPVSCRVVSGPNVGANFPLTTTDYNGQAKFNSRGNSPGTDTIQIIAGALGGGTCSCRAQVIWSAGGVYRSGNVPVFIPKGPPIPGAYSERRSTLDIEENILIRDVNVRVYFFHRKREDLTAWLMSPSGREVQLFTNLARGGEDIGSTCSPMPDCVIDDQAPTSIAIAAAPFIGRFKSTGLSLSSFNNETAAGTWTLRIRDTNRDEELDQSNSGTLECWCLEINSPPLCSLAPQVDRGLPGSSHEVIATVMRDSTPIQDVELQFAVRGRNGGTSGSCAPETCRTDSSGRVRFLYTSNGAPGNDTVEASGMVAGTPIGGTAQMSWFSSSNTEFSFGPPFASAPIFVPYTVRATVRSNGIPASNVPVTFKVFGSGGNFRIASNFRGEVTTNSDGEAGFVYTRTMDEADLIRAEATIEGERFSREVTVGWLSGIVCMLDPPTATNKVVGDSHTVTARVWRAGSPVSSVPVTFQIVSGPNADAPDAIQTIITDLNGEARFTYGGDGGLFEGFNGALGTDLIKVNGSVGFQSFGSEAKVIWDTGASLEPKHSVIHRSDNVFCLGTPRGAVACMTFTLRDHGLPVPGAGVSVRFAANSCVLPSGVDTITDANGEFTFDVPFDYLCPPYQVSVAASTRLPSSGQLFVRRALIEFVE
jgi:subtilisin-like proprotein convertase family protein